MTKEEVLQNCTINDLIVKLPEGQLDRKLYQEVAKSLILIGGKWKGGKTMGFVFKQDPTELLASVNNGEKRNLKKEFQFFATPDSLSDELVRLALIEENGSVAEFQAGQGAIIEAILRKHPNKEIFIMEMMNVNCIVLKQKGFNPVQADYLEYKGGKFDRIIANPPFSKNQDIDHVMKMYSDLKPNGRLVSITSKHWKLSKNKKETEFREWLDKLEADVIEIEEGSFKENGTTVGGYILVIDKKL